LITESLQKIELKRIKVKRSGESDPSLRYKVHVGDDGTLYFHSVQRLRRGEEFRGVTFDKWHALVDSWHGEPVFRLAAEGRAKPIKPGKRKFGKRYQSLRETKSSEVKLPDLAWLSFAVCDSCGWNGWIVDGLFAKEKNPRSKIERRKGILRRQGNRAVLRDADTEQTCPICNEQLFRTIVKRQLRSAMRR
jgi:hypothetical protein